MPDPRTAPSTRPTTTATTVTEEHPSGGLSLTQVLGGALAAVTSAVAASFLGVAGTLVGAAVGSVVATIAATLYSNSLNRVATVSRTLVVKQTLASADPGAGPRPAEPLNASAGEPAPAEHLAPESAQESARASVWERVRWKPVLLAAAGVFVAAMAVISVSELALGHPIANASEKGTTLTNIGGSQPSQTSTPTSTPTSTATTSTSETATPTPTGSASPTTSGPSPTPSDPSATGTAPSSSSSTTAPGATAPTTAPTTGQSSSTSAPATRR